MSATAFYGTLLACGTVLVVLTLLYWQWGERRRRESELSEEDRTHFASQDVRRWVVSGVMTCLAGGILLGSSTPHRQNGRPNIWFIAVWLTVFLLVLVLAVLALVDWLATRRYARRHRSSIVHEGLELLRDEMRLRVSKEFESRIDEGSNGQVPD